MTHENIPFDADFDQPSMLASQGGWLAGTPSKTAFAFGFISAVAGAAILTLLIVL